MLLTDTFFINISYEFYIVICTMWSEVLLFTDEITCRTVYQMDVVKDFDITSWFLIYLWTFS